LNDLNQHQVYKIFFQICFASFLNAMLKFHKCVLPTKIVFAFSSSPFRLLVPSRLHSVLYSHLHFWITGKHYDAPHYIFFSILC
jgi:hypothetical protein